MTADMLASSRAKYDIPSSVIMIIPELSDQADSFPVGYVALNSTILHAGLRLPIPRVI